MQSAKSKESAKCREQSAREKSGFFAPWTLLFALLLAACRAEIAGAQPVIALEQVATGLDSPLAITSTGSDGRLFITLQRGVVVILDGTRILPQPFLDIRGLVLSGGERGLLSVAFHPRYRENGFFYVNYTDLSGDTVVARYKVSSNPDLADSGSSLTLLRIGQPFPNHNGGQLQFGPDGYLYIGMGDGGSGGDPENRAHNLNELLGKMLRIDVDHVSQGRPYAIPPSNPFVGRGGAREEIWALGVRNPWRFSFDRATGDLWIADVGQVKWEEVHLQPAASQGGENYGWRLMEGAHCFNPASGCNNGSLVLPVIEYNHGEGCSITGGYRYRGGRYPRLYGLYFYGDFCTGFVWTAVESDGRWIATRVLETGLSISTFGEDAEGEIYVAGLSEGKIFRIVDSAPRGPRRRGVRR